MGRCPFFGCRWRFQFLFGFCWATKANLTSWLHSNVRLLEPAYWSSNLAHFLRNGRRTASCLVWLATRPLMITFSSSLSILTRFKPSLESRVFDQYPLFQWSDNLVYRCVWILFLLYLLLFLIISAVAVPLLWAARKCFGFLRRIMSISRSYLDRLTNLCRLSPIWTVL